MLCKNCNAQIPDNAKFCAKCGTKQEAAAASSSAPNAPLGAPSQPGKPIKSPKKGNKSVKVLLTIVIVLLVGCLAAGGYLAYDRFLKDSEPKTEEKSSSPKHETSDDEDETETPEKSEKKAAKSVDISQINSIIASYAYSNTDVAVSVTDLNGKKTYSTANSRQQFVAAGLYAPIYLAAKESGNSAAIENSRLMLSSMDNEAANTAIDALGGLHYVNNILLDNNFAATSYSRNFGDAKASNQGYENYSCSRDAVRSLTYLYDDGSYLLMNVDLNNEGIAVPDGVVIHAHRGMGIGDAYNIFAIVESETYSYALAVFTHGLSIADAKIMMSEILLNIDAQLI